MSDMLQHQEFYTEEIRRHQAESQRWAQAGMLARLAHSAREQTQAHPRRARLIALTTPMAVIVGLLAIII